MAINYKDFCYPNTTKQGKGLINGLKANKDFDKFLYQFRVEGRQYRKVFDSASPNHKKPDRIKKANEEALKYRKQKEEEMQTETVFTLDTTFKQLAEKYLILKLKAKPIIKNPENRKTILLDDDDWIANTKWTKEKMVMLDHYIYPHLKGQKASTIKEMNIDKIRTSMEVEGHGRQNKDGCSPRTIRKVLLQVLKPILEYGYRNGALRRIPEIDVPSKPKKKSVKDGTEKLATLYKSIHTLYKEDPFYRGLFLFAFFGRRWNEIRTLEWSDIDFNKMKYTVRAENSKIDEDKTFALPKDIAEALSHFVDSAGLVFKSPKTDHELSTPKKQMEKLKKASGIENLTLHYFRHIMATALSDSGMVGTVLSASLGHNDSSTVDNFYRTANHLKGSEEATKTIEHIVEVKEDE